MHKYKCFICNRVLESNVTKQVILPGGEKDYLGLSIQSCAKHLSVCVVLADKFSRDRDLAVMVLRSAGLL